jgi:DNA primase
MSVTDDIKSQLDIVDIVSEYLPLRKSGTSYSGFCPFHPNTRTPAFVVFPNTQTWRCFGACAEGGDVFSFVMKKEGWEFREALVHLAERAGVSLAEPSPAARERQALDDRLIDLLHSAADYFHQVLLYAPQAEAARAYIRDRDLNEETLETFKIGYALDSWDAGRKHFNMQGYGDDDLIAAGLLTVNEEKESRYDRFRNRLMIPIRRTGGQVVGFGARTLDPEGIPKYLNSPQTAVFDKGRLLFGLDLAKRHIREARQLAIVEGYMDVMQAWQAGFRNVVAQMGTALTEEQLRLAKRFAKRFVLALDADAAGVSATMRSLEVAREVLDREPDAGFDARGLIKHEGRLRADIRVVTLPEGQDPDKIIRTDPELWTQLVSAAKPIVTYVIDVTTEDLDMDDAKAKTAVAQQIIPLINDVADPAEREHYRMQLARKLDIDERVLYKMPARSPRARTPRAHPEQEALQEKTGARRQAAGMAVAMGGGMVATNLREENFLRQCLSHPQIIEKVDKKLSLVHQPRVSGQDFGRPDDRALWRHLQNWAGHMPVATVEDLCDSLDDEVLQKRVRSLLALPDTIESELERLPDKLALSVLDLRLQKVKSLIGKVEGLFREAEGLERGEMVMYAGQLQELTHQFSSISRAQAAMRAVGQRDVKAPANSG